MLFLFSNIKTKAGKPLAQGAAFMMKKNAKLHPGNDDFYLTTQNDPLHTCVDNLGPDSQFEEGAYRLPPGEAAIIIAHGRNDGKLLDEDYQDVTDAVARLMNRIATDNPNGGYTFFLAACGGAKLQPGALSSLLKKLVDDTTAMAAQLKEGKIKCWGYIAEAGLVEITPKMGLPGELTGMHIYGIIEDENRVEQHCGYDTSVTAQLLWAANEKDKIETYVKFLRYPRVEYQKVLAWVNAGYKPNMKEQFPTLYGTLKPTSK